MDHREPIGFLDLLARPRVAADLRVVYGQDPLQFGELWLPPGRGPHPAVILIHGGCWLAELPGLELMDYAAEDLRRAGFAVWNIEYRRIGHAGGGYPGTFQDVARAVDHLRTLAEPHELNLRRVAVSGHSAGGHLAVWTLARSRLARSSPLWCADPLPLRGAVSLAGILDLAAYRADGPDACGGPGTIDALVDAAQRSDAPFADTSPPELLPLSARQVIVSGDLDPIVPSAFGRAYGETARRAGDPVAVLDIARAGHFELIDPAAPAWAQVRAEIAGLLA